MIDFECSQLDAEELSAFIARQEEAERLERREAVRIRAAMYNCRWCSGFLVGGVKG